MASVTAFKRLSDFRFDLETAIRTGLKWIQRNLFLAAGCAFAVFLVILGVRYVLNRADGILSEPLSRGPIVQSVYGIGTIMANRSFQLKPGLMLTIDALYVKEGDSVPKGARLASIDGISYFAPFDGTITYLPSKVGENVSAALPVLSLVNLSDRYLVVSLEQQGALQVKKGQKVRMSFDTIRDQYYSGIVESIYSNGNDFLARIELKELPDRILPGMTADVAIEIQTHAEALLVPVAALESGSVWRKRGLAVPERVTVTTGILDREFAEITSGDLQPGDRVLIKTRAP